MVAQHTCTHDSKVHINPNTSTHGGDGGVPCSLPPDNLLWFVHTCTPLALSTELGGTGRPWDMHPPSDRHVQPYTIVVYIHTGLLWSVHTCAPLALSTELGGTGRP